MSTVLEDIKASKGYILGVIAFATAISTFLTTVLGLALEPTLISVAGGAIALLYIGWLIQKSEQRQVESLKKHENFALEQIERVSKNLADIKDITLENQRASLRIEMGNEIKRHPQNHDTILRMAERYFLPPEKGGLGGDWYMSDVLMTWAETEKVHLPSALGESLEKH